MLDRHVPVLFVSRKGISLYVVDPNSPPKVKTIFEQPANFRTLTENIQKNLNSVGKKDWRILFSDELSYVLEFEVPKTAKNIEDIASEKVVKSVPELLERYEWDYQIVKENKDKKLVRVFAPVSAYGRSVYKIISDAKINIRTVESETQARERNQNPLIGIALKTDFSKPSAKARPYLSYLILALSLILLIGAIVLLYNPKLLPIPQLY